MSSRLSIRDLAKLAGVSRTTVSLALRGSHKISASTRDTIQALAQKHGYRSHPAVNALMQQVGRGHKINDEEIIAFIQSGNEPEEHAPGPLEILKGAREEAHRLGYKMENFWAGPGASDSERLARILYHRGIRGVIWGPMPYPHPPIRFPWDHFVPIACTSSTDIPYLPIVSIHHPKGMASVIEALDMRGAKRIGVLENHVEDWRHDFGWLLGVDLYKHRGGKSFVSTLILKRDPDEKKIRDWIDKQHLDALIASHEHFIKTEFLNGKLPRASLDVPGAEVGLTAGLFQNMAKLGQHAVRSMAIRLSNGILGLPEHPFSVVAQASFVDGKSLGKLTRI